MSVHSPNRPVAKVQSMSALPRDIRHQPAPRSRRRLQCRDGGRCFRSSCGPAKVGPPGDCDSHYLGFVGDERSTNSHISLARATAAAHNSIESRRLNGVFLTRAPENKAPEKETPAVAPKLDAFDVSALERSLNDSATRVSTIWVSFLIFSLYLLNTAATVTHRQLFLPEPLKLPVLNIDLPLWGFFFLAPILFVILHVYVLLQVLLLARTAVAYNAAVERADLL